MCKKNFKFKLKLSNYWQNIKFSPNYSKSYIFTKCNFWSLIGTFQTNCFYPINFMTGTCEHLLFYFCQLRAIKGFHQSWISAYVFELHIWCWLNLIHVNLFSVERLRTPVRQEFSYGIRHFSSWFTDLWLTGQCITMKTRRIPYIWKWLSSGVRNLPSV